MYDKKGVPIYLGDLLKITRQVNGKKVVEYNLVGDCIKKQFGTFYRWLAINMNGAFIDVQDENQIFDNIEIVQGYGDDKVPMYKERLKVKVPKTKV